MISITKKQMPRRWRVTEPGLGRSLPPKKTAASRRLFFSVGVTGFEPATSSSRTTRSTKLSYTPMVSRITVFRLRGAKIRYVTRRLFACCLSPATRHLISNGRSRIRTCEGVRQRVYSPSPLTTQESARWIVFAIRLPRIENLGFRGFRGSSHFGGSILYPRSMKRATAISGSLLLMPGAYCQVPLL